MSTSPHVARLGLGGEGAVLRSHGRGREAEALVERALELGITHFDTARAYADSEAYLGAALRSERDRVFLASKTGARDAGGAARDLDETLSALRTDRLDLWQIHDLRSREEWLEISGPGGALEAMEQARAAGTVRSLGITAQQSPEVLAEALRAYRFDAVLLPANVAEAELPGFLTDVVDAASETGARVLGMLVMAQGLLPEMGFPPDLLLRFALSLPATVLVVGADSVEQLEANVESIAQGPLTPEEQRELRAAAAPFADVLAFYRSERPLLTPKVPDAA